MVLPCEECQGKCCTYPVFTPRELMIVRVAHGIPVGARIDPIEHVASYDPVFAPPGSEALIAHMSDGTCPWLKDGRCSIYQTRPKVCRDYGTVPTLPCAFLYPDLAREKHEERVRRSGRGNI